MKNKRSGRRVRFAITFVFFALFCVCMFITSYAEQGEPNTIIEEVSSGDLAVSGPGVTMDPEATGVVSPDQTETPESDDPSFVTPLPDDETVPTEDTVPVDGAVSGAASEETTISTPTPRPLKVSSVTAPEGSGPAVKALNEGEKAIITAADVTLPDVFLSGSVYIKVGGYYLPEPTVDYEQVGISREIYESQVKGNLEYFFINSYGTHIYSDSAILMPDSYKIGLSFIDPTIATDVDLPEEYLGNNTLITGKTLTVSYYPPPTDWNLVLSVDGALGGKTDYNNVPWYRAVTYKPAAGYGFVDEDARYSDISGTKYYAKYTDSTMEEYEQTVDQEPISLWMAYHKSESDKLVMDQISFTGYRLDVDAPTVSDLVFFGTAEYPSGTNYITDKNTKTLGLRYKGLSDAVVTPDTGASGVDSVAYKLSDSGDYDADRFDEIDAKAEDSITDIGGQDWPQQEFTADISNFSNGDAIYAYTRITDVAGNVAYRKDFFGYISYDEPRFSSGDIKLNQVLKNSSDETIYLLSLSNDTYPVTVRDRNLKSVTVNSENRTLSYDADGGFVTEYVSAPASGVRTYVFEASDQSDRINKLTLHCVSAELSVDTGADPINMSLTYGYSEDEAMAVGSLFSVNMNIDGSLDAKASVKSAVIGDDTVMDYLRSETGEGGSAGIKTANYVIRAKEGLDAGTYATTLDLEYDFDGLTGPSGEKAVLLGRTGGRLRKVINLTVNKAPLGMQYAKGVSPHSTDTGSTETRGTRLSLTDWADRLSIDPDSLKNGDTVDDVLSDTTYQKPVIKSITAPLSAIDENGTILADATVEFALEEGAAAANYYYPGDRLIRGVMTVVPSAFVKTNGTQIGAYYVDGQTGTTGWYTSDVVMGPENGYLIMNAGTGTCRYNETTGRVEITGQNYREYDRTKPIDQQFNNNKFIVPYQQNNGSGVVQYFYLYDEANDVVSDLMFEEILFEYKGATPAPTPTPTGTPGPVPTASPDDPDEPGTVTLNSVVIPSERYGYRETDTAIVTWKGGSNLTIRDVWISGLPASAASYFSVERIGASGRWGVEALPGLEAGTYKGTIYAKFSDHETRSAAFSFTVTKGVLTAMYQLSKTSYSRGERIVDDGRMVVYGFARGEGRENSVDGSVVRASGYVEPTIVLPSVADETVWIEPKGGQAKNYNFVYAGTYLTIAKEQVEPGVMYVTTPGRPDNGWWKSGIRLSGGVLKNGKKYRISYYADGRDAKDYIDLTSDTGDGVITIYLVEADTGQIYGPEYFRYRIDTKVPVIKGVNNGETYVTTEGQEVIVTDDNLDSVTVNGERMPISGGKSVFTLRAVMPAQTYTIIATDKAGWQTSYTVYFRQPSSGSEGAVPSSTPVVSTPEPTLVPPTATAPPGEVVSNIEVLDGAPNATIVSGDSDIGAAVLDKSEQEAVANGSSLSLRLLIRDISGEVSQTDKEKAFAALDDYTIAQYLTISLWKRVGGGAESQIFQTNSPLSIGITVPSSMRTDKADRSFAMIRISPDGTDMIKDADKVPSEVTFATDRFDAIYVLAYRDSPLSENPTAAEEDSDHTKEDSDRSDKNDKKTADLSDASPDTGDRAPLIPTGIAFVVSFVGMITAIVIRRRRANG